MRYILGLVIFLLWPFTSMPLGILAHEAVVDQLWEHDMKPLLLQKYPKASEEEMLKAKAYAYGGAIIPDIGYFPFGSKQFSHLVHYVRSGDFVKALVDESESLYQFAFAMGVITHYEADRIGHMECTNLAVPMMFPKLAKKHGDIVTYEQGCTRHGRMEFGFDVVQTARGNYETTAYHKFIGFEINDTVLARAFLKTYGMKLDDVFGSMTLAISVFRFSVRTVIPELTRDAWKIKNSVITKVNPLATQETYVYKINRREYKKEFKQPIIPSFFITVIIAVIPKVSVFSHFNPKMPNEKAEALFDSSFNNIMPHCAARYVRMHSETKAPLNVNLDTGKETQRGDYELADETYYKLLMALKKNRFESASPELRENILAYYAGDSPRPLSTRKERKIRQALAELRIDEPSPYSTKKEQ